MILARVLWDERLGALRRGYLGLEAEPTDPVEWREDGEWLREADAETLEDFAAQGGEEDARAALAAGWLGRPIEGVRLRAWYRGAEILRREFGGASSARSRASAPGAVR